MRSFFISILLFVSGFNIFAQSNSYNMIITLANGTTISIGGNDIKNISFNDGQISMDGQELDNIIKIMMDSLACLDEDLKVVSAEVKTTQTIVDAIVKKTDNTITITDVKSSSEGLTISMSNGQSYFIKEGLSAEEIATLKDAIKKEILRPTISKNILFLGDSTSYGAGEGGNTSTSGNISWTDHLVKMIEFFKYNKLARNSALCMDDGSHPKLFTQVQSVVNDNIDDAIIIVMIGTNDINLNMPLGEVEEVMNMSYNDLNDMTSFAMAFRYNMETLIRNCPHSHILCMTPVSPLGVFINGSGYLEPNVALRKKVEQYVDIEREICSYLSIPLIETMKECGITPYAGTQHKVTSDTTSNSFMADNYHPNGSGNEKIAYYVASKLRCLFP